MKKPELPAKLQRPQRILLFVGLILMLVAVVVGLLTGSDRQGAGSDHWEHVTSDVRRDTVKRENGTGGRHRLDEAEVSGRHRQPLQFRTKPVEPAAVLAVLASGKQTVDERVRQLQAMRGISLSMEEREAALSFLAGKELPEGMGRGSVDWLSDELLTALRLQEPPQDDLADQLAKVAFQPDTNPVVRDYIMQHLGHLWEQYGPRKEIDAALWRAVGTSDETTPGTALIALSRGYERDQQQKSLEKIRQRALELAKALDTGLAIRVTALSIAGDGGGLEVKELAADLLRNDDTPVILKKVAEHMVR